MDRTPSYDGYSTSMFDVGTLVRCSDLNLYVVSNVDGNKKWIRKYEEATEIVSVDENTKILNKRCTFMRISPCLQKTSSDPEAKICKTSTVDIMRKKRGRPRKEILASNIKKKRKPRVLTKYNVFMKDNFRKLMEENPSISSKSCMGILKTMWNEYKL
jgi:hypothetical protein